MNESLRPQALGSLGTMTCALGIPKGIPKVILRDPWGSLGHRSDVACTMMLLAVGVSDTTMATSHLPGSAGPGSSRETSQDQTTNAVLMVSQC